MHDIFNPYHIFQYSWKCQIIQKEVILDEEYNEEDDDSIQSLIQRHRLELELLRERQRRELQLARLRLRHNQPGNGNTLVTTGGGCLTRSIDSCGSGPQDPIHIPYHSLASSRINPHLKLPLSISLPGSPPQNSFLGQHLESLRDTLPRRSYMVTSLAECARHTSVDAALSRRPTYPSAHCSSHINNNVADQHRHQHHHYHHYHHHHQQQQQQQQQQ
ncbi:unnamed protein product, partial [Onchocerca flexuosa]|uniref:CCDC92 domain-containing protein n=1 Tax=Onchocerca flexuosa TaxID=387005 RepID=A0A183HJN8_9BILA